MRQNALSSFTYTSASETDNRATIESRRSGASMTEAVESMADNSRGSSVPPSPASSVARTNKSGGRDSGGNAQVNNKGNSKPVGGSASGSSSLAISSSKPSKARGSTSSERCRSMGPSQASSGCRSTSHSWRNE